MQVIVLYSNDGPALSMEVLPVAGDTEAIMKYGEELCAEHEAAGMHNMQFVLTTVDGTPVQCYSK